MTKHDEGWCPSVGLALWANCVFSSYFWRKPVPKTRMRTEERREPSRECGMGFRYREGLRTLINPPLSAGHGPGAFHTHGMSLEPCSVKIFIQPPGSTCLPSSVALEAIDGWLGSLCPVLKDPCLSWTPSFPLFQPTWSARVTVSQQAGIRTLLNLVQRPESLGAGMEA